MADHYDVLIVGGGIAGLTLANVLATTCGGSEIRIGVIEKTLVTPIAADDAPELRVSAINFASQQILRHTGIWDRLLADRVCAYQSMHVWDAGSMAVIDFCSEQMALDELGHIIENRVLMSALLDTLQMHSQVQLLCPQQIESIRRIDESWHVALENGDAMTAQLLVGADGQRSMVRGAANISQHYTPYHQQGIVCNLVTEYPHRHTAWQRFLATGPLAFLPMTGNVSSIVWTLDDVVARRIMALDDSAFTSELEQAIDYQLGAVSHLSQRVAFPLGHGHAAKMVSEGVALIGDAAHTIHPLAGQGANLGILDAACLAEVIHKALIDDKDISALSVLRRYERWRKGETLAMEHAMTVFDALFSNTNPLLGLVRSIGLNAVDRLALVKIRMMSRAMGIEGDLPAMAVPSLHR